MSPRRLPTSKDDLSPEQCQADASGFTKRKSGPDHQEKGELDSRNPSIESVTITKLTFTECARHLTYDTSLPYDPSARPSFFILKVEPRSRCLGNNCGRARTMRNPYSLFIIVNREPLDTPYLRFWREKCSDREKNRQFGTGFENTTCSKRAET